MLPAPGSRRQFVLIWLCVSAAIALSHFAFFRHLGLYEDDHWMIGMPMCEWKWADLLKAETDVLTDFPQGRPLHLGLGFLLAYTSTHVGGLPGAHACAAAIWALNAGLCLALFWRHYGPAVATPAALVSALLPADTTHALVHAVFAVQPSVTFLLLSGLAYSRGRPLLALFPAGLALLTYETCFLPALAWPVLFPDAARTLGRRCLTHGALMGIVLLAVMAVRSQVGESRLSGALSDKHAALRQAVEMGMGGPAAALKSFGSRPALTVDAWASGSAWAGPVLKSHKMFAVTLGAGAMILCACALARPRSGAATVHAAPDVALVRLLAGGALMVVLAYASALNREPGIDGRNASVNIGAAPGWGVLFAVLVSVTGRLLARARAGWALVPVLAAYLTLLAGFHILVQREYARAWAAQGEFWKDVTEECPDVRFGTMILYPLVTQASPMIRDQEWSDYLVYEHLFVVPQGHPPQAYGYGYGLPHPARDPETYGWREVEPAGDKLCWRHWDGALRPLEQGNVIVLRVTPEGRFERVTGTLHTPAGDLLLKPREERVFGLAPATLFPAMFRRGLEPDPRRRGPR